MIRTAFWYIHFVFSLVILIPKMYKYGHLAKEMPPDQYLEAVNEIVRKWAMTHIKASGAQVNVTGLENVPKDGAVLFVANHQSNFDIAVFMCFIPRAKAYVSKVQLLKVPLLRTWMKYLSCVFLDRDDMRKSAKAINDCITILKSGYSMVVFPEGTRSKTGHLGEFKAGSFKLATKSKVPIIPVTISGTRDIMEANHYWIKPAKVNVVIHPPIYTADMSREEAVALPEKVKDIISHQYT